MIQYLPAMIMFLITVGFASLFCLPATLLKKKSALFNFYWRCFWGFLALITGLAGGSSTLMLLGYESFTFANAALAGVMAAYVSFVVFAWFRLVGTGVFRFIAPKLSRP